MLEEKFTPLINAPFLKDNFVEFIKATILYLIVIAACPNIVTLITEQSYELAVNALKNKRNRFTVQLLTSDSLNNKTADKPSAYIINAFITTINTNKGKKLKTIAPAAALFYWLIKTYDIGSYPSSNMIFCAPFFTSLNKSRHIWRHHDDCI